MMLITLSEVFEKFPKLSLRTVLRIKSKGLFQVRLINLHIILLGYSWLTEVFSLLHEQEEILQIEDDELFLAWKYFGS